MQSITTISATYKLKVIRVEIVFEIAGYNKVLSHYILISTELF